MRNGNRLLKTALFLFFALNIHAAEPVDFYATVTSSSDTNTIKMTTDLLFSQFQSVNGYTVNDKRNKLYSADEAVASNISFFAEIQEDENGGWICTLNAIKASQHKNVSSTKKYDSYYKILMDAKPSLENLMENLNSNSPINKLPQIADEKKPSAESTQKTESNIYEMIAGTWSGEELIEKVLILRGGKGFVIFKNGASMNIAITASGSNLKITQTSKPNASFYPELTREIALKSVENASPITWDLHLVNKNTLTGTKTTLLMDNKNKNAEEGSVNITWNRK